MKKIVIALLAVVMVLCSIGLVACDSAKVLDDYIFEYDGTVVTKDFVLPKTIGNKDAKWSSNNNAVTLTKGEDSWTATINFPEADQVTVTLTLTVGGKSKDFTVIVKAIDVYNIADNYNFLQKKATVTADFELDTETTFKGKKATIEWTVDEAYENYIAIDKNDAGKTICKVTPQSEQTAVKIKAIFTYNGVSATYPYDMTVYKTMEGYELVDYWYNNTGVSITMSGYVVEIATAYSDSYNNVSLYMVNDDFTAGYYLYRVGCDADNGKLLQPGVHVTCTGTTNTNYNGLIETNAGGTLVVDTDKDAINVRDHVYAVDQEIIGNLPATVYNESRLVSLTNWTVKSIDATDENLSSGNFTLMTITKGGVEVNVRMSKYLEGAYSSSVGNATFDSIVALRDTYGTKGDDGKYTVKEGATISVTGILSKYSKAWQIMPLAATDITEGTKEETATADFVGTKVATAIAAVNSTLKDNALDKRVTATTTATLPTTSGDVAISYRAIGSKSAVFSGENNNVLTVTPGSREQSTLEITYTLGEFKTVQFVYITSLVPTASTMLDDLKEKMPTSIKAVFDLPTMDGATIEWEVHKGEKDGKTVIEIINGQIVPTLYEEEIKGMSVTAKLTYQGVTKSKNFVFAVEAGKGAEPIDMSTIAEDTAYVLAIDQTNLSKQLYALNDMNGYYGATTDDFSKAESIYVEFAKDTDGSVTGYKLYFKTKSAKNYIRIVKSEGYTNFKLDGTTETASVFTYDETNKCLKTTLDGSEYYIGTYKTYNTVSVSAISNISGSFPAYLGKETFKQLAIREIEVKTTNATVTGVADGDTAKDGQRLTFAAAVTEDYTLTVTVNGKTVNPVNGVYTVIISGDTKIVATGVAGKTPKEKYLESVVETPVAGTEYKLAMWQNSEGKVYYATGKMSGYYLGATTDVASAAVAKLEETTGGYFLKLGDKYVKIVGRDNNGNLATSISLSDKGETVFTIGANHELILTATLDSKSGNFYLGTHDTYTTMGANAVSYISGTNTTKIDVSQYVARLVVATATGDEA